MATKLLIDKLYFGTAMPSGHVVTQEQFESFVDRVITRRFPDGLTIYEARGQWRGKLTDCVITKEKTYVVELVHTDSPVADLAIKFITDYYKDCFNQESVMRVSTTALVDF